jgi:hypothetical protein
MAATGSVVFESSGGWVIEWRGPMTGDHVTERAEPLSVCGAGSVGEASGSAARSRREQGKQFVLFGTLARKDKCLFARSGRQGEIHPGDDAPCQEFIASKAGVRVA